MFSVFLIFSHLIIFGLIFFLKAAQDAGMNVVMIPDTEAVVKSVDVISSLGNKVVAYRGPQNILEYKSLRLRDC